jgi:N-acetylmuramoyl-L-alanine amidase
VTGSAPLILEAPSPNFGPRREGAQPDLIVLHYTAMTSAEAALSRLCDPRAEVSAHYLIAADGRIWRMVAEDQRAWHAGAGAWGGVQDVNSRSIGIELDNSGQHPFSEPQMAALEWLLRGIMRRWRIAPERVIAHSDMAPERKCDPGPRFDWRRLARQGLSVWPDPIPPENLAQAIERTFPDMAHGFGYSADASDEACLAAFRSRFRPGAEGPLAREDAALMAVLAARWPALPSAVG